MILFSCLGLLCRLYQVSVCEMLVEFSQRLINEHMLSILIAPSCNSLPQGRERDCLAMAVQSPACRLIFVSGLEAITAASISAVWSMRQLSNYVHVCALQCFNNFPCITTSPNDCPPLTFPRDIVAAQPQIACTSSVGNLCGNLTGPDNAVRTSIVTADALPEYTPGAPLIPRLLRIALPLDPKAPIALP